MKGVVINRENLYDFAEGLLSSVAFDVRNYENAASFINKQEILNQYNEHYQLLRSYYGMLYHKGYNPLEMFKDMNKYYGISLEPREDLKETFKHLATEFKDNDSLIFPISYEKYDKIIQTGYYANEIKRSAAVDRQLAEEHGNMERGNQSNDIERER